MTSFPIGVGKVEINGYQCDHIHAPGVQITRSTLATGSVGRIGVAFPQKLKEVPTNLRLIPPPGSRGFVSTREYRIGEYYLYDKSPWGFEYVFDVFDELINTPSKRHRPIINKFKEILLS